MENYVGKRLAGRYEVQEIIGVGGMSVVYKAYDNVDDRIVAVKVLKEEFSNNEEFRRRFKNESKAIALLSHPNIVKVFDVNFGEQLQYIVMEYIDGITLKEYITKQGAITWNDAVFFMSQILRAVQHAHDKGIVHRDIKPQNIILLPNGNIKVTDFGIARFSRSETRTLTDTAIGSVHYIAPEQAKGENTDEKADIYSLGVVLYEMLAGNVPFEADSAVSVALMQLQANAKRLTQINADIPLGLEQICIHAMEKSPANRYQTATEMLLDIEEIIKNPNTVFDYVSSHVDNTPTRIINKNDVIDAVDAQNKDNYVEQDVYTTTDPDHKKKVISAVAIGVIVLITAIVLVVMAFTGKMNTSTNKLENFVGTSYDQLIDNKTYKYEFIADYQKDSNYNPGEVISQSPEAGSKVLENSQVKLVVAQSEDDINLANVYGLKSDKAVEVFKNAGLTNIKILEKASDSVSEGQVVYTDPKAGTIVGTDTEVTIYVSTGPTTTVVQTLKMPDVSGLTQSGARAFLEKYGFTNVSFATQDNPIEKGVVISQSPSAGESVQATDSIRVVLSSGVTTTTTEKAYKISITVNLPKCTDANNDYKSDRLQIKVGNKTYLNQTVVLNGKSKEFSITYDTTTPQTIIVSLDGLGAADSKTATAKKDYAFVIDFRGFSSSEEKTTTEKTTKHEEKTTKTNENEKE